MLKTNSALWRIIKASKALGILLSAFISLSVQAEQIMEEPVTVSVYVDNDLLIGGNKDEDYTGGFAITYSGTNAANHPFSIDKGLVWINTLTGISSVEEAAHSWHSCETGLTAFTPTDKIIEQAIVNDRPYSSLIYLSNTQQTVDEKSRSAIISSLTLGFLGLSLTGELQNTIHGATGSDKAEGWHNQISKGGEPTFKYSATWQKYLITNNENLQATTSLGLSIGYLTEAVAGASFRSGLLRTPWWSFNVHNSNYGEKSNITVPTTRFHDEFYFLAGANMKLRAYNAFLQGQFRDSAVTYSAAELEPFVYEGWVGVGGELKSGIRLSYLLRYQSSELKTGVADRGFSYGEMIVSYKF